MGKAIKLQIRKELDGHQQLNVIRLKGSLISNGYTEIIHINDFDDEFHINTFETSPNNADEVLNFINVFINQKELNNTVTVY
ncbi:hypothetical protein [Flavobacterium mesophilum]|uniref:hypothetical protein n=1 Tax=Flavobacterium mesophilum TaxID=3143495 RepID=UPI0031DDE6AE